MRAAVAALLLVVNLNLSAQTVTLSSTVLEATPRRIGLNDAGGANYDTGQLWKNLAQSSNAGGEPLLATKQFTQASTGTACVATSPDIYDTVSANRFAGATYYIQESPNGNKGLTGTVSSNTAGAYPNGAAYTLGGSCSGNVIGAGDQVVIVSEPVPTPEAVLEASEGGFNCTVTNGGKVTGDTTTPFDGKQSIVYDATANGSSTASCTWYFNNGAGNNFVALNGTYLQSLAMKLVSGSATGLTYTVSGGGTTTCTLNPTITTSWATYTQNCTEAQGSGAGGTMALTVTVANGTKAESDDIVFQKTSGQNAGNTSVFRDEVIATAKAWNVSQTGPWGVTRDWVNNNAETLNGTGTGGDNWILPMLQKAWSAAGRGDYPNAYPVPQLQDILLKDELTHTLPYLEIPCSMTNTQASNLISFLESTNTSTGYGAKRAALGQTLPWVGPTGVFPVAFLSYCNESWNSTFVGQNIPYRSGATSYQWDYATRVGDVYNAIHSNADYLSANTQLGFNLQIGAVGGDLSSNATLMAAAGGAPDYFEQAPYLMAQMSESAPNWPVILNDAYGSSTGYGSLSGFSPAVASIVALNKCGATGTATCQAFVYEESNATQSSCTTTGATPACTGGNPAVTQAVMDEINAGAGQGLAAFVQALTNINSLNIPVQPYWGMTEYQNSTYPGTTPATTNKLFGVVVDMGGATSYLNSATFGGSYTPRGAMLGIQVLNTAIIGQRIACPLTSAPTTSQAANSFDGPVVAQSTVPLMGAACWTDGAGNYAVAVYNADTTSHTLTLAGTGLPTGTINVTKFVPSSLNLLNEANSGSSSNATAATMSLATATTSGTSLTVAANSVNAFLYASSGGSSSGGPVITGSARITGTARVQ